MFDVAKRFIRFWRIERKAEKERKALQTALADWMKRSGKTSIPVGRKVLQLCAGSRRGITRSALVRFFGKKKGDLFWSKVKPKSFEYLTVLGATLLLIIPISLLQ